jgi:hypothetical protein
MNDVTLTRYQVAIFPNGPHERICPVFSETFLLALVLLRQFVSYAFDSRCIWPPTEVVTRAAPNRGIQPMTPSIHPTGNAEVQRTSGFAICTSNASRSTDFVDRRTQSSNPQGAERRQFGSKYPELSQEGRELALAIDDYKFQNHRRYITCDELMSIFSSLGYRRS